MRPVKRVPYEFGTVLQSTDPADEGRMVMYLSPAPAYIGAANMMQALVLSERKTHAGPEPGDIAWFHRSEWEVVE